MTDNRPSNEELVEFLRAGFNFRFKVLELEDTEPDNIVEEKEEE